MKMKAYLVSLLGTALLALSIPSSAQEPVRGPTWGAPGSALNNTYEMMGGHGGGMSGGHGGGMMEGGMSGYGEWIAKFLDSFSDRFKKSDPQRDQEVERLKREIRQKRQELSSLFHSDNPDRKTIDQKIAELNRLEDELDKKLNSSR
ncbi:MAG: hypothetical protein JRJ03_06010 [Deltaproteobacteria bacterium]|nr:hypothetical protein [Deltaproteobacteria bacterium]